MIELAPVFARHETFHPRIGWISKAVQAVERHPYVFADDGATVALGVGKNMVHAIRYWATAMKVIAESVGRGEMRVTPLGRYLLAEDGVDPYAEDPTTLWLLQWSLLTPPVTAPTWWWAFGMLDLVDFDLAEVLRAEREWVAQFDWPNSSRLADTSISKDLDCLVRMYGRRGGSLDALDSPFASLGLVEAVPASARRWRFVSGPKTNLDPRIVLLAGLIAMIRWMPTSQTISVARLSGEPGGPGRTFRLTESAMASAIREAATMCPEVTVVAPAGLTQIVVQGDKRLLGLRLLRDLYGAEPEAAVLEALIGPTSEPSGAAL